MKLEELKNKRVAIAGMGVNNRHLAEYFRAHGVKFAIVEWQDLAELGSKLSGFEIIFRTPGLPYLSAAIQNAKNNGAEISSQTKLFFDLCPAKIIGITGTKGKGTTATLIHRILDVALRQAQGSKVYLAGNIGRDPFAFLDELQAGDFVVLELSSFQLQDLHNSPHIAVVLKTTSEHLDHHKIVEEYRAAKENIVAHQNAEDFAVLNYDSEITRALADKTAAKIYWNSVQQEVKPGAFIKGDKVYLDDLEIMNAEEVGLLGRFNLENITAAIAAAAAAGINDLAAIKKAVREFKGLEHRLEFVADIKGVKYYNDSFATTPESTIAALTAFAAPIILIAGGSEKNSDYTDLARAIAGSHVRLIIPIGVTGPKIAETARKTGYQGRISEKEFKNMEEIVSEADAVAESGDVVLLSPASASFGLFHDYKHRGELFRKYVIIRAH
ncbi:MAG: UDP-N-acetylmuramoyl-L-alanine--D-glutamate ligase [Candidatus Doudnabacteria bacterium]|nr:UDP-N-acetylmuramoyl-L-alanine--D-glutamate ligase [Candidatus Doudnabacteria bacterium]